MHSEVSDKDVDVLSQTYSPIASHDGLAASHLANNWALLR